MAESTDGGDSIQPKGSVAEFKKSILGKKSEEARAKAINNFYSSTFESRSTPRTIEEEAIAASIVESVMSGKKKSHQFLIQN